MNDKWKKKILLLLYMEFQRIHEKLFLQRFVKQKKKRDSIQNLLLLSQITSEGSFSASPNGSPSKSRTKTGVPVKSMFEGVQFTANPLSDYQGFEKKTKLWQMYEFF